MIRIYGGSDDLVEIEGLDLVEESDDDDDRDDDGPVAGLTRAAARPDEIPCYDSTVEIAIGGEKGGVVVTMDYGEPGVWSAQIRQIAEDVPVPWPVRIGPPGGARHKTWGYSVCVEIDAPDNIPVKVAIEKRGELVDLRERVGRLSASNKELEKRNEELEQLERSVKRALGGAR